MLIAYSIAYAPPKLKPLFYEMGNYSILFYFSHVIAIIVVANLVFWLKDIDPRFRDGEDTSFDDIPSLVEHKKRLEASGNTHTERAKAAYFVNNIKGDVKEFGLDLQDKVNGIASLVTGGLIRKRERVRAGGSDRNRSQSFSSNHSDDVEFGYAHSHGTNNNSDDSPTPHSYAHNNSNTMHTSFSKHSPSNSNSSTQATYSDIRLPLDIISEEDETAHSPVLNPVHQHESNSTSSSTV